MKPSPYQQAIYDAVSDPQGGNIVVEAGAGSGKTTTLTQLVSRLRGSHIALAFGKPIQLEMERRGLNAKTFHGLCYGVALRQSFILPDGSMVAQSLEADKVKNHLRDVMQSDDARLYFGFVWKLVDLAKNAGIGVLIEDTEQAWSDLAEHHTLELEHEEADWARAIELARETLRWNNSSPVIDFNDMLYRIVKNGVSLPKFDNVIVDEAQDVNAIQIAIIRKLMKPGSRLIAVGDSAQAIYGFRGAESNALANIVESFNARRLPLTVSYRCARAIVDFASQFGAIEAHENAAAGSVVRGDVDQLLAGSRPGDLVVSRCTKPLIELAYQFLKVRKPAYVMGKDIGAGLVALIKKRNAQGIDRLVAKLNAYADKECERLIAKGQESGAEALQDKVDTILFLIDNLSERERTIPALIAQIERLFADKANAVVLATTHKAKGLEADRVYWLNYDWSSRYAQRDWQKQQEVNLRYVAATRAKNELVLIPQPRKER